MPDLKDVHERIRSIKKEKKQLSEIFRDALAQSKSYQEVLDELKELKAKKLRLEAQIYEDFSSELEKAERLSENLKTDTQLLSDMALTKFMKGETVEIVDEYDMKYEPVFKVTFKKTNVIASN